MGQRAPELQGLRGTCVHFRELCLAAASPKTDGVLERKTAKETALRPASSAWLEPGTNVTHKETAQQLRDPKNYGCRAEAHEGRGWRGPERRPRSQGQAAARHELREGSQDEAKTSGPSGGCREPDAKSVRSALSGVYAVGPSENRQ